MESITRAGDKDFGVRTIAIVATSSGEVSVNVGLAPSSSVVTSGCQDTKVGTNALEAWVMQ